MSKFDNLRVTEYLRHIIEAIHRIERYTADMTEVVFLGDEKTQDAVVRNFEIIGEACNNVSKKYPEFAAQNSEVPWGFAYEMRNALAHGYHKVDFELYGKPSTPICICFWIRSKMFSRKRNKRIKHLLTGRSNP